MGQRRKKKEHDILLAARSVFLEHGYGGASVDLIAAEAKVSKATVYSYFESKEQLFIRMLEEYCTEQETAIGAIEQSKLATFEGLYKVADIIVASLNQQQALQFNRMMLGEAERFPLLGRMFVEAGVCRLQLVLAGIFKSLDEKGELRVPDPQIAAEIFIGSLRSSLQIRSLRALGRTVPKTDTDKLERHVVELMLAAYKPD